MSEESAIRSTTSENDLASNKLKIGEIFLLKDHSQTLNCIQCLREFQHFTEFTLHIQEHYSHCDIVPFDRKVKTENHIEEVLIKIEPEHCFENDGDTPPKGYSGYDDAKDEFVYSTTDKNGTVSTEPTIKNELEIDETEKFTCGLCGWVCKAKRYLKTHIETHSDSRVGCDICGKKVTAKNMKGHMKIHSNTSDFLCSQCGMSFTNKGNLTLHLIVHEQEFKYQCEFCSRQFIRSDKCLQHIRRTHDDQIKFHCSSCSLGFMSKRSMIRHENLHLTKPHEDVTIERKREYPCDVCDIIYKCRKALRVHKQKHLANVCMDRTKDVDAVFQCGGCDLRFKYQTSMARHQKKKHPELCNASTASKVTCEYCGKELYERFMEQHIRIHTGNKDYVCDVCGKGFGRRRLVIQHLKTHNKPTEPPLKAPCDYCGKEVYAKNMTQHVKIHTAKKDFVCTICNKGFIRNTLLTQHLITHEQSFKYQCDFCSDKYLRYGQFLAHLRKEHGESMKFHCSSCNMGFMHKAALSTHETRHLAKVT